MGTEAIVESVVEEASISICALFYGDGIDTCLEVPVTTELPDT
jgi:hypothetical protein